MPLPTSDRRHSLEDWLRSPRRRALLVAVAVLLVAAGSAFFRHERSLLRRGDSPWGVIFALQLLQWWMWAAAAWPLLAFARWLLAKRGSWLVFAAVQIPFSVLVATGSAKLDDHLADRFLGWEGSPRTSDRLGPPRPAPGTLPGDSGDDRTSSWTRRREQWERIRFWQVQLPGELFTYWFVLALGATVTTYLASRDQERRARELELRTERLRTELAHAQIGSLRSQIHPHFLFNALNSVSGLIRSGNTEVALGTVAAIGELLRTTLDSDDEQEITVEEELRIAERYLEIERIRFGDRLRTSTRSDPSASSQLVPALLLLALVENAVQYAVAPRAEGGSVELEVSLRDRRLVLVVSDDGPGFPEEVLRGGNGTSDRTHIGLANCRKRLAATYGDEAEMTLENRPEGGARVRIELPAS